MDLFVNGESTKSVLLYNTVTFWLSSWCELKVLVKFDRSFNRIPHPDAALEESISEVMFVYLYHTSIWRMHASIVILYICWSCRYGTKAFSRTHLYTAVQSFGYVFLALSWHALFCCSTDTWSLEDATIYWQTCCIKMRKLKASWILSCLVHALYEDDLYKKTCLRSEFTQAPKCSSRRLC